MRKTVIGIAAALAGLASAASAASLPPYHAIVLGIADGRPDLQVANPVALNRWGQMLGRYGAPQTNGTHAVLWTPASANDGSGIGATLFPIETSPGMPSGTASTYPAAFNDRGEVAGTAYTPGAGDGNQTQSWLWRPKTLNSTKGALHGGGGTTVTFPLLAEANGSSAEYVAGINNRGVIVANVLHPAVFTPAVPNSLTGSWSVEISNGGHPSGINDAGQFVGASCSGGAPWNGPYLHKGVPPMLASDTLSSPLWISPNGPTCVGGAAAINARGHVLINAVSSSANIIDTYIYRNGIVTDLNPGKGGGGSALNNYDQVLGSIFTGSNHATLMQHGQVLDLNLLNDSTNGLVLSSGVAINDAGQILANANYPGAGAPTLLTPFALVTNPVKITAAPPVISGATTKIAFTITNLGTSAISGPVSLALDGLTPGVKLRNTNGVTFYSRPGSVYANVAAADLPAGATTSPYTLVFNNPGLKTIAFSGRVLGTTAPR